jgi:hypothetical protein
MFLTVLWIVALCVKSAHCDCQLNASANTAICGDFQSWTDFNKMVLNMNQITIFNITAIQIQPSLPILFTSELDFAGLLSALNINESLGNQFKVNIIEISGIEVTGWPSNTVVNQIIFQQSQIEFYINGTSLSNLQCSRDIVSAYNATFFNMFTSIVFLQQNKYPSQPVCPFIFTNTQVLNELRIFNQLNSSRTKNLWQFQPYQTNSLGSINSSIYTLNVGGSGYNLDTNLVNPLVFESITSLLVLRSLASLQTDIFKYFQHLSLVNFQLDSLSSFFHGIGIEWTSHLQNGSWVVFNDQNQNAINNSFYTYPDADFCLFRHWPHHKFILPVLVTANLTNCTGLIRWMLQTYYEQDMSDVFYQFPSSQSIYLSCLNSTFWNHTLSQDPSYFQKKIFECSNGSENTNNSVTSSSSSSTTLVSTTAMASSATTTSYSITSKSSSSSSTTTIFINSTASTTSASSSASSSVTTRTTTVGATTVGATTTKSSSASSLDKVNLPIIVLLSLTGVLILLRF